MHLLFPGRHHLLTDFQFKYLYRILQAGLKDEPDVNGIPLGQDNNIEDIIFVVTSANHSNTRRNPLPFYLRVMALQEFSKELNVPAYIFGIDDVGHLDDFATYIIKKIKHETDGQFDLTPENTLILCSTPVLSMYEELGFKILPAELENRKEQKFCNQLPWDIVEHIANSEVDWRKDRHVLEKIHPASYRVWVRYNLGDKLKILFKDKIIGDDGDITCTRDYNSYVRQMDEIAELKYKDTASYIKSGRIGDIGCAVGSWIRLACHDEKFRESDFYGIEVARHLFDICQQRKFNGDFENPFVFFAQKNAVTGLVFETGSMNTIHTSSLTHEIESYGSHEDLMKFIQNRWQELVTGGVWINRDVTGPEDKEDIVYMKLTKEDGRNDNFDKLYDNREELEKYLSGLSTFVKFLRFAKDFRYKEGYRMDYTIVTMDNVDYIKLKLKDACEFMSKKDYIDNWQSEMHETFCFWSFNDWKYNLEKAGFKLLPHSKAYANSWIVEERYKNKVELYKFKNCKLIKQEYPVTNVFLVAEKLPYLKY